MPYLNDELLVRVEMQYGLRRIYPVCETSKNLLALTGDRTFCDSTMNRLKKMGFVFTSVKPEPDNL